MPDSPHLVKIHARTFRVLQNLSRLEFDSCLDVGGAEGYTVALVRRLFGSTAVCADSSRAFGATARRLSGLESICADAHRLPFRAGSFDVVYSSETIEHLEHPVEAALEMLRVAGKAVLISTCEASRSPILAWISGKLARYEKEIAAGGHISFFRGADFQTLLGDATRLGNQFIKPAVSHRSTRELRYTGQDREQIKAALRRITWTWRYLPGSRGIVALRVLDPAALRPTPRHDDEDLLDAILSHDADWALRRPPESGAAPPSLPAPAGGSLRDRVECPRCGKAERLDTLLTSCPACGYSGSVVDGVPVLTPEARPATPGSLDRGRYAATVASAGCSFESLLRVKRRLERRRGVRNGLGRRALHLGRRALRIVEAARRAGYVLRERMRGAAS